MNIFKVTKGYVSEIDLFLADFDKAHPKKSASQKAEITKFARIGKLRDQAHQEEKDEIWKDF